MKPLTNVIWIDSLNCLLAGSGEDDPEGGVDSEFGGGENGGSNGGGGAVRPGDKFVGGLGAKGNTAWDTWDD